MKKVFYEKAPPWAVEHWFNTNEPISLASLHGKVVVLEAFPVSKVAVIGLHTVFEHHEAMTPVSLRAFLHEYRITFPVGVDKSGISNGLPLTMQAYQMQGTPTLVLIDANGYVRHHHFGQVGDLQLGAEIAQLVFETPVPDNGTCIDAS